MVTRNNTSLSGRLKVVGTNDTFNSSRGDIELNIGLNNRKFSDSKFTKAIQAPTVIGTYYSHSVNDSSFTNTLKLNGDKFKSKYYAKIENFIMYDVAPGELLEKRDDEDRNLSIGLAERTLIILAGTIRPAEGDHFVRAAAGHLDKPYVITDVTVESLLDREVYKIVMEPSSLYASAKEIDANNVCQEYMFLESNIGSSNKVIIEKAVVRTMSQLYAILDDLNAEYVEAFYNDVTDLMYIQSISSPSIIFNLRSLTKFQDKTEVLKYGYDRSTLKFNNAYKINSDDTNFSKSFYRKLLRGRGILGVKREVSGDNSVSPENIITQTLMDNFENISSMINEERDMETLEFHDGIEELSLLFYTKFMYPKQHKILSNLYGSDNTLVELLDMRQNMYLLNNTSVKEQGCYITIRNPLYINILNIFNTDISDDKRMELLKSSDFFEGLSDYSIDRCDISDYLLFPVLKYIIETIINRVTKDDMFVSY